MVPTGLTRQPFERPDREHPGCRIVTFEHSDQVRYRLLVTLSGGFDDRGITSRRFGGVEVRRGVDAAASQATSQQDRGKATDCGTAQLSIRTPEHAPCYGRKSSRAVWPPATLNTNRQVE